MKKNLITKRILAMLLAITMVLTMNMAVYAEDAGNPASEGTIAEEPESIVSPEAENKPDTEEPEVKPAKAQDAIETENQENIPGEIGNALPSLSLFAASTNLVKNETKNIEYASLQDAIDNANEDGDTITLLDNITLDSPVTITDKKVPSAPQLPCPLIHEGN